MRADLTFSPSVPGQTQLTDFRQQFIEAIRGAGFNAPGEVVADGALHRWALNGQPSKKDGWYVLYGDGIPAGCFGDWRDSEKKHYWRLDLGRKLTTAEEVTHRARVKEMRRTREAKEIKRHAEARKEAQRIWNAAKPASHDHPYLKRKGVQSHDLRVNTQGRLILPLRIDGELHSVQTIDASGREKRFLACGRKSGCYFSIGLKARADEEKLLLIAEGYATAASIHEATGHTTVVAFDAGNILPVARHLKARYPEYRLMMCADDDADTSGNPGLTKATEAAEAVDGLLAVPDFGSDRPKGVSDFNDLAGLRGAAAVRAAIEKALAKEDAKAERAAIVAEAVLDGGSTGYDNTVNAEPEEELILDPGDPAPSARKFVARHHSNEQLRTLQRQSGVFFKYRPSANVFREIDEATVRSELYRFLEPAKRWIEKKTDPGKLVLGPFKPTKSKVDNVMDALRAECNLSADKSAPCWLDDRRNLSPYDVVACRNGLLHLPTRQLLSSTPQFFTLTSVDFPYNPKAPRPENWLGFLSQLWPDDSQSAETLQEWTGYLLTQRTHFQKALMLVGPKRSGKGTIGRVIRMLLGDRNVCGPTLANLAEQFGLSILIGKSLAIVADARISGRTDTAVITERLLSISGEDTLSIPRKFLPDWNGKLPARFMLMTNELPRLEDSSGAMASRFIVLMLTRSFYGQEDHSLLDRFIPELPGILLWALDGWDRLSKRGRFQQPESASQLIQEFEDLGSPITAFLRERCEIGRGYEVMQDRLFDSWKEWCEENGREKSGTVQMFARNIRAAIPWLNVIRPRVMGAQVRLWTGLRLKVESR